MANKRYRLDRLEMPELLDIEPKIRAKALRQGARVAALEVRRIVPDSGRTHAHKLKKSIKYSVVSRATKVKIKSTAPHAHLVHDGTKPHTIQASSKEKARAGWRWYRGSTRRKVRHPGARAFPFLVEAADNVRPEMIRVTTEVAIEALSQVANGQ